MRKIISILKNNKGLSNMTLCVCFLLVMVLFVSYMCLELQVYAVVRDTESAVRTALDKYSTIYARENSESIKNSNEYVQLIMNYRILTLISENIANSSFQPEYDKGKVYFSDATKDKYEMYDIKVSYRQTNTLDYKAEYSIKVPLYFCGFKLTATRKDVIVLASYTSKFD